ncbi:MAG: restriction endonuclease [Ignavibacteriales bacterium]|nr:MAG: restriction endonuclease [Ignavibacteriales bacterium]
MSVIDFTELKGYVKGEHFEALIREIAKQLGLSVSWSGRGADEGKDLIFTEIRKGAISNNVSKWLVQCKDFSKTGKSVNENDVGAITDKVKQHKADGYLLATTTVVSSGLMKKLEALDISKGGEIFIKVWDYSELVGYLSREEFKDITKQYLPESYRNLSLYDSVDGALSIFRKKLPEDSYNKIQQIIRETVLIKELPSGNAVWPYSDSSNIIDKINKYLAIGDFSNAANVTPGIEYEAFMLFVERLAEYENSLAYEYLLTLIRELTEQDIIFNCVKYIIDNFEISPDVNIEILSHLDDEGKSMLLDDQIMSVIDEKITMNSCDYNFYSYIDSLSTNTTIDEVYVDYINYESDSLEEIKFKGQLSLHLELCHGSGSDSDCFSRTVKCNYNGFMDANGIYLNEVEVDESEFGKV